MLSRLFACERPIVAVTGHFGAWELLAGLLGRVYEDPRPRMVIVRKYADPVAHAFIKKYREATGAQMIGHRNAVLSVMRALRHNGIAAFLVDHNTKKDEAIFLPFLGEEAAVNAGPAVLAVRSGAIVWPMVLSRRDSGYVFLLQEPLDTATLEGTAEEKIRNTAEFYTQAMEKFIRNEPEQWFWMHNRWKTKPQEHETAPAGIQGPDKSAAPPQV
jgi:KDO2-lipid IV(A) lauroyltransferase